MSTGDGQSATFSVLTASKSGDVGTRRGALFRLFQSDHFDAIMALIYLWKYNQQEMGLRLAICQRLIQRPEHEIQFILPQLCHLAIYNEIETPAVEHLLLTSCWRSLHGAIFTLWYFENALEDLRKSFPKSGAIYLRTLRILNTLQKTLFRESSVNFNHLTSSDSSLDDAFKGMNGFRMEVASRLLPSVGINIIGAGMSLGGVYVSRLGESTKNMLQIESRRISYGRAPKLGKAIRHISSSNLSNLSLSAPSVEDLSSDSAFSLREYILKAAKQMNIGNSRSSFFSLSNATQPPVIPHYYLPEMQFVMSLIELSSRLVTVARDGRLKALSAELTLLNHNFPASICLPLWCLAEETTRHHRILRIPPNDAVVLNSAERVPLLLQIEILENDCDDEEFEALSRNAQATARTCLRMSSAESSRAQVTSEEANGPVIATPMADEALQLSPDALYPIRDFDETDVEAMALSSDEFTERMRSAAIMLAQLTKQAANPKCGTKKQLELNAIKAKIIREMEMLEKNRLLDALQRNDDEEALPELGLPIDRRTFFDKEDPSAVVFQESFEEREERIRSSSPFGDLEGWKLLSVIVKAGADMRQEQLACQLIAEMYSIWRRARLPLWTYSYRVLVTANNGGLIETVPNAISMHSIKKNAYLRNKNNPSFVFSLRSHFIKNFGSPDSDSFRTARDNFMQSLAAYSLATYVLQVKDRHDGNILLDRDGHLIHIDFGFMLSNSPGYVGFESAPFKLSQDYIELLGGIHSPEFSTLKDLIFQGFLELRKHSDRIFVLLEMLQMNSGLPCFYSGESAMAQLRQRLHLTLTDSQLRQVVDRLVISSAFNVFTKLYDSYQYYYNGIF